MKYKLICLDMDGTLYNDDHVIPVENINTLKKAYDKGIKIAIATGRLYNFAALYEKDLGFPIDIIASNGGYTKYKDEVLIHNTVSEKDLFFMYKVFENYSLSTFFNTKNSLISKNDLNKENAYLKGNLKLPKEKKILITKTESLKETLKEYKNEIIKTITIEKDNPRKLLEIEKEFENSKNLQAVYSSPYNLEIYNKTVSKANGIKALIERLGIKREEVIAIGDGGNDLSMISYAGIGVAMGNAPLSIKKFADIIADTNNNNGVSKIIEKLCF